jgi:hypothetical protein
MLRGLMKSCPDQSDCGMTQRERRTRAMSMKKATYGDIRDRVLPGDVIAFLGRNPLSALIKFAGASGVSHVGVIVGAGTAAQEPRFAESSVHVDDKKPTYAVAVTSFRLRVEEYDGAIWWLPMDPAARPTFNEHGFSQFIESAVGKFFDLPAGIEVVLRGLEEKILHAQLPVDARIGLQKGYCCSGLVASALKASGLVNIGDPAEESPTDVCSWRIYAPDYFLLKGDGDPVIRGYNTVTPQAP